MNLYNILSLLSTNHLNMYIFKLFNIMLTQMESNAQQVERANGLTNFNPIYGLRDHRLPPLYILQLTTCYCLFRYLQGFITNNINAFIYQWMQLSGRTT